MSCPCPDFAADGGDCVDLIVGEYRVRSWHPGDLDFAAEISLPPSDLPGGWAYVRAHQCDGEYAWSSPIWLAREGPLPSAGDLPRWNQDVVDLTAIGGNEAEQYLADLVHYLEVEEDMARFQGITPIGVRDLSMGPCALFYCHWEKLPMSIRWFFEYEIPKIRYDLGWRDYGAYDELEWSSRLGQRRL